MNFAAAVEPSRTSAFVLRTLSLTFLVFLAATLQPRLLAAKPAPAAASGANLIQSPDPLLSDGKAAPGWTLTGQASAAPEPEYIREGMANVTPRAARGSKLSQTITAPPRTELLVTAEVRSNGKIVGYAGESRMSYHKQGQWQTLAGFARVGETGKLDISFLSNSLDGKSPAKLEIRNVAAKALQRPEVLERNPASSQTPIVSAGTAQATIVYPSCDASFRQLAEQVAAKIQTITGVAVPLLSDAEATAADAPRLRQDLRGRHLVLIGRLGINRAMWMAYNHWLDATDGYYPGGDGYVVRTAVDVLGNARNHIILGGSTDKGVGRAVEKFVTMLDGAKGSRGELSVPFLLDVELGGECLQAFKQHDASWTAADPNDRSLPPVEPGYGSVRRWYENAMGWYWSGWDSYRQRAGQTLAVVLKDRAYTHHYIAEFLVRTYDMVDETGLLTPDQRTQMETLILANFLDFATKAGDGAWMTTFTPPYDNIEVMNRHQISPWTADLTIAEFLSRTFKLPADLKALAEFRGSEKDAFFKDMLSERWESSLPGGMDETQEELSMVMMRRALETEQYDFFNKGLARKMLNLEKISPVTGAWVRPGGSVDTRHIFTTLASYYHDGRYLWLSRHLPCIGVPFMNRTVNGVHRYVPGPELAEQEPSDLAGVQIPEMMPHRQRQLAGLNSKKFGKISFDPKQVFDFASFRSGFAREDDYVAVNGLVGQGIPGVFLSFMSQGVEWLPRIAGGSDSYFDHNAVHVLRTDRWSEEVSPFAAAAQLDWKADLRQTGAVAFALDPHAGTRWQRAVVWVRNGLYVVRDTVTPKESGQYQIMINWRPAGVGTWRDGAWLAKSGAAQMRITPLSGDFAVTPYGLESADASEASRRLSLLASRKINGGESLSATAVLHAYRDQASASQRARAIENGVLIYDATNNAADTAVLFGASAAAGLKGDARCIVLGRDRIEILAAKSLDLGGKALLRCDVPVSVNINPAKGELIVDVPNGAGKKSVQVAGQDLTVEEGTSTVHAEALASLGQALQQALDGLASAPAVVAKAADAKGSTPAPAAPSTPWRQTWKFDDLRQPMPVTQASIKDGVMDLGRDVLIGEIRPKRADGAWRTIKLPEDLRYATAADAGGGAPPADSPLWKVFSDKPQMLPGVATGNYGRGEPTAADHEALYPKQVRARFLRSTRIAGLTICGAENPGRQAPLTVRAADLDGDGKEEIVVNTLAWPKFLRPTYFVKDTVAVLSGDGRQQFRQDYNERLQSADLLQFEDNKPPSLTVTTQDGIIRVLRPDGQIARQFDLYQLHQLFHKTFGRENTRHPAGGFTQPFAIGPWRPAGSAPGLAVARYHCFSFIGADGKLEGVLMNGSYVQPAMLSRGIDFDADGHEEQLCLGRGVLFRLHGPLDQRVEDPNSSTFFPQVYHAERLPEPAWEDRIDGAKPLVFQSVKVGGSSEGRPRFVMSVRDNYCAMYDGTSNRWAFSWVPLVSIRAAAVVRDEPDRVAIAAITEDGFLWRLEFGSDPSKLAKFSVHPLSVELNDVAAVNGGPGQLVLAGRQGLYLCNEEGSLSQIAQGSFLEARPATPAGGIIAVGQDGSIQRFDSPTGSR